MYETTLKNDRNRGIFLYILELQNDKYYVGITNLPEKRFSTDRKGKTSKFVRDNLPIVDIHYEQLRTTKRYIALKLETEKTVDLIIEFGIENVFGGEITGSLKQRIKKFKAYVENFKKINNL